MDLIRVRNPIVWTVVAALALTGPAAAAISLARFTARAGEEAGFAPRGKPATFRTVRAWLAGETPRRLRTDTVRLRREGFILAVSQPMRYLPHPRQGEGVSSVVELRSSGAARAEQRVWFRQIIAREGKLQIRRFSISGVPGAQAFTATTPNQPGGAANALFTEGRCVLLVGDALIPRGADLAGPVTSGVQAVYRRTGGHCP